MEPELIPTESGAIEVPASGELSRPEEWEAARAVQRVIGGGCLRLHDDGHADALYDFELAYRDCVVALEVTSDGLGEWLKTRARIRSNADLFAGDGLTQWWWVIATSGCDIRELGRVLPDVLATLETAGIPAADARRPPDDDGARESVAAAAAVGARSMCVVQPGPPGSPKINVLPAYSATGAGPGALTAAIARVFGRADNQRKLREAPPGHERHLCVFMADLGADAVLGDMWPLAQPCPGDPEGVIQVLWIRGSSESYVYRVEPGTASWSRYHDLTGASA